MSRHQFLRALHRKLAPRTYLEIGVSDGRSLTLSRARSIGVDPAFKVTAPVCCDLELVRATSDEFFAERPTLFDGAVVDLAFIDGLHVAEFAFRDFINVERRSVQVVGKVEAELLREKVANGIGDVAEA